MVKRSGLGVWILLLAILHLIPRQGFGEKQSGQGHLLQVAREIIENARWCSLITVDDEGFPVARTMDPFPPDKDFKIRLATNRFARKVGQIRENPKVSLYYFDQSSPGYVTLIGVARVVDDRKTKAAFWKGEWHDFYEDDNRGDDYVLLEVTPKRLEIVSIRDRVASDPKSWKAAIYQFGTLEENE